MQRTATCSHSCSSCFYLTSVLSNCFYLCPSTSYFLGFCPIAPFIYLMLVQQEWAHIGIFIGIFTVIFSREPYKKIYPPCLLVDTSEITKWYISICLFTTLLPAHSAILHAPSLTQRVLFFAIFVLFTSNSEFSCLHDAIVDCFLCTANTVIGFFSSCNPFHAPEDTGANFRWNRKWALFC